MGVVGIDSEQMERERHIGVDAEDWDYALLKVETSYGIKFQNNELAHVRTMGQLLDVIDAKIPGRNEHDCTSQQAFYRLRTALATQLNIDPGMILPDSMLDTVVPRKGRRRTIAQVEFHVGAPLDVFGMKQWMMILLAALFLGSLVCFIWSDRLALLGLGSFGVLLGMALLTAKEFKVSTVGDLAERLSQRSYRAMRRDYASVNRKELRGKLKQLFQDELGLAPDELREDILLVP